MTLRRCVSNVTERDNFHAQLEQTPRKEQMYGRAMKGCVGDGEVEGSIKNHSLRTKLKMHRPQRENCRSQMTGINCPKIYGYCAALRSVTYCAALRTVTLFLK